MLLLMNPTSRVKNCV